MLRARDLSDGKEPVSHAELIYLKELAVQLPADPMIVNIGAAEGLSTMAFLEARPDAVIYSVDVNPCPQEIEHVKQGGHDVRRVIRLLGRSQDIGPAYPYQCDMLFIDGDHWGAGGDLVAWVDGGKVRPGGTVALHDYQEVCPPNNPGSVYDDVTAWHAQHPEYEQLGRVDRVIAFKVPG